MPTYEYRCPKGHKFELLQRITDPAGASCPECGAAAERVISGGAGFLFKGEGFYITDYRSDDYKKKASNEPGAKPPPTPGGGEATKPAKADDGAKTSPKDEGAKAPKGGDAPGSKGSSSSSDA